MSSELVATGERLGAFFARVALLPLMRADVLAEVGRLGEGRSAAGVGAVEGLCASVGACGKKIKRYYLQNPSNGIV